MNDANRTDVPRWRIPLYARVILGVALGAAVGAYWGKRPFFTGGSYTALDLEDFGKVVIKALKALAAPLVFFGIVDSLIKTNIRGRQGLKLIAICLFNLTVAMSIGLAILHFFQPGATWLEQRPAVANKESEQRREASLSPLENFKKYIPDSLLSPFVENNVISIVLLGILTGAALRRVRLRQQQDGAASSVASIEDFVEAAFQALMQMLEWIVQVVPIAVFCTTAAVVGKYGIDVFRPLWVFLATMMAGLLLHALVYYPIAAWLFGKKSPRVYLGRGADAIVTGLSTNSSLATVPVTLRCLDSMGVSPASARLSACIGTNLNNDGIMLYEAMAAIFVLQSYGDALPFAEQIKIVMASVMAGVGIAGIPEAGIILLPVVLSSVGLSDTAIAETMPLLLPVDWIIARTRSGVNVMADMLVAIMLDGGRKHSAPASQSVE